MTEVDLLLTQEKLMYGKTGKIENTTTIVGWGRRDGRSPFVP